MSDDAFRKYDPAGFNYVTDKKANILKAADALGVSPTAVAAAIAKEQNSYETHQGTVRFLDRGLDDFVKLETYRLGDTMLRSEATAATALGLDEQLRGVTGKSLKLVFPTLADVGVANIKVSTAIKLLDDYLDKNPTDPLGLAKYKSDAGQFIRDLIDPKEPTTALVSALMVKEAQDFYLTPSVDAQGRQTNIDATTWAATSQEVRDGLTTMYFTLGKNAMESKRADNIDRNGVYEPRLGEGDSGGLWTVQNAREIGSALGVVDYGKTIVNGLDLEIVHSSGETSTTPRPPSGTFVAPIDGSQVTLLAGGTISDIWKTQKDAGNVFTLAEFSEAILVANPSITDINKVQTGQVVSVPHKLPDGSISYSYPSGVNLITNPANGDYNITTPNANGDGFTVYSRVADQNGLGGEGYTVKVTQLNSEGQIVKDTIGRTSTVNGDYTSLVEHSVTTDPDGQPVIQSLDLLIASPAQPTLATTDAATQQILDVFGKPAVISRDNDVQLADAGTGTVSDAGPGISVPTGNGSTSNRPPALADTGTVAPDSVATGPDGSD
ncbi:MAG: hypothetical protein WAW73_09960, partial [Rhodoferax sp.]